MIDELFAYSKCLWWGELYPNYLGHYIIHVTNDIYSAVHELLIYYHSELALYNQSFWLVVMGSAFFFSVGKLYVTCSLKHCRSIYLLKLELPC